MAQPPVLQGGSAGEEEQFERVAVAVAVAVAVTLLPGLCSGFIHPALGDVADDDTVRGVPQGRVGLMAG